MTTKIALWLVAAIVALFVADAFVLNWGLPVIFGRLMISVLDWVAFWH